MNLDAVYLVYWSVKDPLTQSQSLPVLRALSSRGYRMGLITYEQAPLFHDEVERRKICLELKDEGIRWFPLRYHRRPRLLATLWDICRGVWLCLRLSRRFGVSLFHSRGTVTAAAAFVAAKVSGASFFYDADGPLSEEYADAGLWPRASPSYRLTRWAEGRFLLAADAVAVLTRARRLELERSSAQSITVLPCAVDTDRFRFDDKARTRLREELSLNGTVMVYAGNWGGWYASDEMMDFVATVREVLADVCLLVLTKDSHHRFMEAAAKRGIDDILILHEVPWRSMPEHLSAADVGLSFVRSLPSKKACSPVKNGEYLACGLPIISTHGIGDYSEMIVRENVGVVIEDLNKTAYRQAARAMGELLLEPNLRSRCRRVAETEAGFNQIVLPRYLQVYRDLLGTLSLASHSEEKVRSIECLSQSPSLRQNSPKRSDS